MTEPITSPKNLLLPYQQRWVDDKSRFKIGCWGRQEGKDFSTAAEIAEDMIENPSSQWMIAAPSERQSLESLEKVKLWIKAYGVVFDTEIIDLDKAEIKATSIVLPNGSRCIAVPGKPDTVRGFSANLVFTEFPYFEQPEKTWKAILPSIVNPLRGGEKKVRIISTPNGKAGQGKKFWELLKDNFFEPKEGRKTVWSVHYVPLKQAIAEGLPVDYDELVEAIADPIVVAQELDCEFLDGCYQLLSLDDVTLAESGYAQSNQPGDYWTTAKVEEHYMGIDFGRTIDPSVAWTAQKQAEVAYTRQIKVMKAMSTPDQVRAVAPVADRCRIICIDYTGPGVGFGDLMAEKYGLYDPANHQYGKIVLVTFSPNLKREIFPRLRTAFQDNRFKIPGGDDVLREDLMAMQQLVNGGNYTYEAPHTKEGHSDRCTAAALCQKAIAIGDSVPPPLPGRFGNDSNSRYTFPSTTRKVKWRGLRNFSNAA